MQFEEKSFGEEIARVRRVYEHSNDAPDCFVFRSRPANA